MIRADSRAFAAAAALTFSAASFVAAQRRRRRDARQCQGAPLGRSRTKLASLAVVDRKVMMPMRDGVRLATDIYRPKNASKKYRSIWVAHALQLQLLGHPERRAAPT